ncbi:Gfo/Idh/MocA family oxidoreductase [Cyclobacterium sediminis]
MVNRRISIGIIGLSVHSADFTEIWNGKNSSLNGQVVSIYHPKGNPDVEFPEKQLQNFAERIEKQGVSTVNSIEEVIERSDAVMLLTNDGRPHLAQVLPILKAGKPVYIDKPLAENLENVMKIFHEAKKYGVKIFSSSALRYGTQNASIKEGRYVGELLGAQTFGPAPLQKSHVDMYWDGIHGIESLYSVMGTGCQTVSRTSSNGTDLVVGKWPGEKLGYFRGIRKGKVGFGGTVFGTDGIKSIGKFEGYQRLVRAIDDFITTGKLPVAPEETMEIYAFMEAADESKRQGGKPINISETINRVKI